jgi:DUF4097 and DUF4098 domain-containing protein YvlB
VQITGRDADEVLVEQADDKLTVVAPRQRAGLFAGDHHLDVVITVPTGSDLAAKLGSADLTATGLLGIAHIRTGSGDVGLDTLEGPSLVETGSGHVLIESARERLRIKSGSGDVQVDGAHSAISISTGSGDVEIGTSNAPAVVKTGSGDLKVVDARTDVAMTTGSGDLVIHTASRGRFTVKGASSDVHIGVPAGVPVWTDVSTISGRISSDLEGAGEPTDGGDYVELRAKTVSGDVTLTQV